MVNNTIVSRIVNKIASYVVAKGDDYDAWYCGITADPEGRLFDDHSVTDDNRKLWITRDALHEDYARAAEARLLDLGFDGGPSGGNASTTHVYAYKKIPGTRK